MPGARPSADLQAPIDFERPTADAFGTAGWPHMAILLDSKDDVPAALASFYGLGLRRNAWLFHRSLPGQAEQDPRALVATRPVAGAPEPGRRPEGCGRPTLDPA